MNEYWHFCAHSSSEFCFLCPSSIFCDGLSVESHCLLCVFVFEWFNDFNNLELYGKPRFAFGRRGDSVVAVVWIFFRKQQMKSHSQAVKPTGSGLNPCWVCRSSEASSQSFVQFPGEKGNSSFDSHFLILLTGVGRVPAFVSVPSRLAGLPSPA